MKRIGRSAVLLGILLASWLATSACSCGSVVQNLSGRAVPRDDQASSVQSAEVPSALPLATPTLVPTAEATPASGNASAVPAEPNRSFTLELTEAQIAQELAGQIFEQQGFQARDVHVLLTTDEIICSFRAAHLESGLSTGITVRGVPVVEGGAAYLRVNDIALDKSLSGFARLVARGIIEQAIKQYSTPQGIPIPTESIEVGSVQLLSGKIIITGRTR